MKERVKRFCIAQEFFEVDAKLRGPVEVEAEEYVTIVEELVKVKKIVKLITFSGTNLRRIYHDYLDMHKISARWVPKHLLELCEADPNPILETMKPWA